MAQDVGVADSFGMQADALTLAHLLSLSALVGATIEYAEIIKRRAARRLAAALREETAEVGLRGLVRVFLADEPGDDKVIAGSR